MSKLGTERRTTAAWLLALLLCAGASAQVGPAGMPEEDEAAVEEVRRYTVEIIVFEYADSVYNGNEMFSVESVTEPEAEPAEPATDEDNVYSDETPPPAPPMVTAKPSLQELPLTRRVEMTVLRPDQFTLQDIYAKLQKLDAYTPILHVGWMQTTVDKDQSPAIRLRALGSPPLGLDGALTLYLSRYLHLVVDLFLEGDRPAGAGGGTTTAESESGFGPRFGLFSKPDLRPPAPRYHIFEDRIFRSGDLRYFDHPKFGVLAKVTRYEPPAEETGRPADPVPAGSP